MLCAPRLPHKEKKKSKTCPPLGLLDGVELAAQEFVHGEHVDLVLPEDSPQLFVTVNVAFVVGVLELVGFDMVPELLDHLWARQLFYSLMWGTYEE